MAENTKENKSEKKELKEEELKKVNGGLWSQGIWTCTCGARNSVSKCWKCGKVKL